MRKILPLILVLSFLQIKHLKAQCGFILNDITSPRDSLCPFEEGYYSVSGDLDSVIWTFGDGITIPTKTISKGYFATGDYDYTVRLVDSCGDDTTFSGTTYVRTRGYFDGYFSIDEPYNICPFEEERINGYGVNSDSWVWEFDNGVTKTGDNFYMTFTESREHSVDVTITDECGNDTTVTRTFDVGLSTWSKGYVDSEIYYTICPGDEVQIWGSDRNQYMLIDWGDGNQDSVRGDDTYIHKYENVGNYTLVATPVDFCGNPEANYSTVTVSNSIEPDSVEVLIPDSVCPGDRVTFYTDPEPYLTFSWDLDEGMSDSAFAPEVIYSTEGLKTIELEVIGRCGSSFQYHEIMVSQEIKKPYLPILGMEVHKSTPTSACAKDSITVSIWPYNERMTISMGDGKGNDLSFTKDTVNAEDYSYVYNIGRVVYKYDSSGTYELTYKYENSCGVLATDTFETLYMKDDPSYLTTDISVVNNFDGYGEDRLCVQDITEFVLEGEGNKLIDFGDGTTMTHNGGSWSVVRHQYSVPGNYNVSVLAVSGCSQTDSDDIDIVIENCSSSGVKEEGKNTSVYIQPNPADDFAVVTVEELGVLQVINSLGAIVNSQRVNSGANQIDLSGLGSGVYIVKFESNAGVSHGRLVVK